MNHSLDGWDIGRHTQRDWTPWGGSTGDARAKVLAVADDYFLTLVEAQPGYSGDAHEHAYPEFLYVLDGQLRTQGVEPPCRRRLRRRDWVRAHRLRHRYRRHVHPDFPRLNELTSVAYPRPERGQVQAPQRLVVNHRRLRDRSRAPTIAHLSHICRSATRAMSQRGRVGRVPSGQTCFSSTARSRVAKPWCSHSSRITTATHVLIGMSVAEGIQGGLCAEAWSSLSGVRSSTTSRMRSM